jgi:hypothetical protein
MIPLAVIGTSATSRRESGIWGGGWRRFWPSRWISRLFETDEAGKVVKPGEQRQAVAAAAGHL